MQTSTSISTLSKRKLNQNMDLHFSKRESNLNIISTLLSKPNPNINLLNSKINLHMAKKELNPIVDLNITKRELNPIN